MTKGHHIEWKVSIADLAHSPLGYKVELGETAAFSPITATHSTFERTSEFQVSVLGDGDFVPYPMYGLTNATESTVVRFLRNGETPTSTLIVAVESFIAKMSLDCKEIMGYKQICETNSYVIESISCSSDGRIWVKDNGGVLTILNRQLDIMGTFQVGYDSIFTAIDPFRGLLWVLTSTEARVLRTVDMSVVATMDLPIEVASVLDWDFSSTSGTFFCVLADSENNTTCVAMKHDGSLVEFGSGATSICQWGALGALACVPSEHAVKLFNGTSASVAFLGSSVGIGDPVGVASNGRDNAFVLDSNGEIVKTDESWTSKWSISTPPYWNNVHLHATGGPMELGRVMYLSCSLGVASYRDMLSEGWLYGVNNMPIPVGSSPSVYPVVAVVPELDCAHVWSRITPESRWEGEQKESSSESSASS